MLLLYLRHDSPKDNARKTQFRIVRNIIVKYTIIRDSTIQRSHAQGYQEPIVFTFFSGLVSEKIS